MTAIARVAYQAYGESTGGVNYQGRPMPTWDELPSRIQLAWMRAVDAVSAAVRGEAGTPMPHPNVQHGYTDGCPHCPDGHYPSEKSTWAVWLGTERDGDGQPMTIHVARPDGAHVAEADADWIRKQLNPHLRDQP